jgi:hypothetical protein
MSSDGPAVFTPQNEPYLGLRSLLAFDRLIVACLKLNALTAPHSRQIEKTDLQRAACQLIPSGISLALSVRELVRQGYLYGALVLLRPLAERTITILYLLLFPEAIELWKRGWLYKERPSLTAMIDQIGGAKFPNVGPEITRSLNSLTHGDPDSAMWNLVAISNGEMGHSPSKILDRPELCDRVCKEASAWLGITVGLMGAIFPAVAQSANDDLDERN